MTWTEARDACAALQPAGRWSLASIVDDSTAASVRFSGNCGGALESGSGYWVGLYDEAGTRSVGSVETSYAGWAWTSGAENDPRPSRRNQLGDAGNSRQPPL